MYIKWIYWHILAIWGRQIDGNHGLSQKTHFHVGTKLCYNIMGSWIPKLCQWNLYENLCPQRAVEGSSTVYLFMNIAILWTIQPSFPLVESWLIKYKKICEFFIYLFPWIWLRHWHANPYFPNRTPKVPLLPACSSYLRKAQLLL